MKTKFALKLIYIWFRYIYLPWSKLISKIIAKVIGKEVLKEVESRSRNTWHNLKEYNLRDRWSKFLSINGPIHWASDPWWMGYDAIINPWISVYRKKDDCDGFATIALNIIGDVATYEGVDYKQQGYLAFIPHLTLYLKRGMNAPAHIVALFYNGESNKYLVISNFEATVVDGLIGVIDNYNYSLAKEDTAAYRVSFTKDFKDIKVDTV